jgi:hypothetical protein
MMSNNFFKNRFSMKTMEAATLLVLSFAMILTVVFAGLVEKKNDTTLDTMNEQILYKGSTSSKYPSQRYLMMISDDDDDFLFEYLILTDLHSNCHLLTHERTHYNMHITHTSHHSMCNIYY